MTYALKKEDINERIDKVLAKLTFKSRNHIVKLIDNSNVLVNGKKVKSSYRLCENDVIEVYDEEKEVDLEVKAENIFLDIVYEDDYLAVINKPYDMVVHPSENIRTNTLVNALLYHFKNLSDIDKDRNGIVHRLDKDTSGLIIVAKNNEVHEKLKNIFKNHEIEKKYIALLHGSVKKSEIAVSSYIGRDKKDRKKISTNTTSGRLAISKFVLLKSNSKYSLVSVNILTGRTHQIRVHAKQIGHPVVGDKVYGKKDSIKRQQLHCKSLKFIHPMTKEQLLIESELAQDMKENIKRLLGD